MSEKKKPCVLCERPARSVIDSVLPICSADTMFYRRNYMLWTKIHCKFNGDCEMTRGNRRLCPACRLRQCRAIGLRMLGKTLVVQRDGKPVDDVPELPSATTSTTPDCQHTTPKPDQSVSPAQINSLRPSDQWYVNPALQHLCKAVQLFKRFCEGLLFFSSVHQDKFFEATNTEFKEIHFDEYPWMENRALQMACEILAERLQDFGELPIEEKIIALKKSAVQSSIISKFYFTVKYFGNAGDSRTALFPAFYMETKNFRQFYRVTQDSDEAMEKLLAFVAPFYKTVFNSSERGRHIVPTAIETSALSALAFYDKLERLNIASGLAARFHDELCWELHQHLREVGYSEKDAIARIPRLTTILQDANLITEMYTDTYSLIGAMVPELREVHAFQRPDVQDKFIHEIVTNHQHQ